MMLIMISKYFTGKMEKFIENTGKIIKRKKKNLSIFILKSVVLINLNLIY